MAKKTKKQNIVVLFDSYNNYDFDEIKANIMEDYDEPISDNYVYDVMSIYQEEDWNEMMSYLQSVEKYHKWVMLGSAGTWQGSRECGQIYENIDKAMSAITQHCEFIKVWSENGHLYVQASHHDGTHNVELKLITDKGWETYDNWMCSNCGASLDAKNRYQVFEMIFDYNLFSKLPRVEKVVLGIGA